MGVLLQEPQYYSLLLQLEQLLLLELNCHVCYKSPHQVTHNSLAALEKLPRNVSCPHGAGCLMGSPGLALLSLFPHGAARGSHRSRARWSGNTARRSQSQGHVHSLNFVNISYAGGFTVSWLGKNMGG